MNFVGGRFNTGSQVNSEAPSFSALYLAKDKDTALQEHLGQTPNKDPRFTPRDWALSNPSSETIVSISGQLDKVFDLTNVENLLPIVELTKNFTIPKNLIRNARLLGIQKLGVIKTSAALFESLLDKNWRYLPTNFDVPSNSQIFGHLIYSSNIEGILYPSKLTGKTCLAVFPNNFSESDSFLVMDDEPPHEIVVRRIDSSNRRVCDLSARELFEEAKGSVVH